MVYQWKVSGIIPVDAQVAGEELDRIYQENGKLEPSKIVEESRLETAPLHKCFEWNDEVAAEKYRENQAQTIIRMITTVVETDNKKPVEVRAFVSTENDYEPITVVLNSEDKKMALLDDAKRELKMFINKYETLSELCGIISAIQSFLDNKSE